MATTCEVGLFQTLAPRFVFPQAETLDWLASLHEAAAHAAGDSATNAAQTRQRLKRFGVKPTQVSARGFDAVDIRNHDPESFGLYGFGPGRERSVYEQGSLLTARSAAYQQRAGELLRELYSPQAEPPAHLVHVTCTGYASPSAAQRLVSANGWSPRTAVTHAYHMGCYAALPAMRLAEGLLLSALNKSAVARPQVDLVHTEMCTLHINPFERSPDQYVIQSLFGDGHIKYTLCAPGTLRRGYRLHAVVEEMLPESAEDMTWVPEAWGFRMVLAKAVPERLSGAIRGFVQRLAEASGFGLGPLLKDSVVAIHPGGPRIIQSLETVLELRPEQTAASKAVLLARGNMSSATLPHVWERILNHPEAQGLPAGTPVVSLAFGPGLTTFGAVFTTL